MSVEVSLKFNALRSIDFIGNFCSRQIPLSPLVFSKTQLKPSKSYDLEGFLFVLISKINRITQLKGVLLGAHVKSIKTSAPTLANPCITKGSVIEHLDLC